MPSLPHPVLLSLMSAERGTTYHLSSWDELLQHKTAETNRRGPYHRTYDSVRVQANSRLMLSPPAPEMDRAARKVYKETVRAQVYLDAKRKHESHATTSTSMVTIVPFNNANNTHVTSTPSAASTAVTTVISTAEGAAPLAPTTFRQRCKQLLGLLWWDNVNESLLPRADARRQLCRWVLSLVELKGMGSPDVPDFAMTLLLYWCQHTINHDVSHTAALTREQLQQNGQLIRRVLGVTGRSLYVPPFVQPNMYQIAGKFADHGAAVFGLIWLFRDHWPISKMPSCASLAEVELNTLTRYVIPLVTSCVEKRASEREWLHELCRLTLRLSPQHLEYAGTFLDDQGQTIHMRDTAFVRQLERHVYAHVEDEPAQWSLLKYIDQRELYYAHVQTKLQQQEELRFELARHQAVAMVKTKEERQWLQDGRAALQNYLAHPTLREYVVEATVGPELRLLSQHNNYQDFCKRVAHDDGARASEEEEDEDVTSFKRRIKRLPRHERTLERQHRQIRKSHMSPAHIKEFFRQEREQLRHARRTRRADDQCRRRRPVVIAARLAEVNDVWKSEPSTPPMVPPSPRDFDRDDADDRYEFDLHLEAQYDEYTAQQEAKERGKTMAQLYEADPREYYFSLWQCHAVNPKWDCRQPPPPYDDETTASTAWSRFRQSQVKTRQEEDAEHDDYCDRNGVGTAFPGSSDNDVEQSKEVGETQADKRECRELLPGSKTAPWTLRSMDGLLECVVYGTNDEDEEDAGRA